MTTPTLEAERAAPTLSPCPFCGAEGDSIDPEGWYKGDGTHGPACDECGATAENDDAWNRRTAAPVAADVALPPLDAELPPLPGRTAFYPDRKAFALGFTSDSMRNYARTAIAPYVERIRLLEREKAERRGWIGSVGDYTQFHVLMEAVCDTSRALEETTTGGAATFAAADKLSTAVNALIAYIDGRTAAGPSHSPAEDDK